MKSIIHKSIAYIMTVSILLSTLSFNIDKHFCGETLVSSSILGKAESCGFDLNNQNKVNKTSSDCSFSKKNCCRNSQYFSQGLEDISTDVNTELKFEHKQLLIAYLHTFTSVFDVINQKQIVKPYKTILLPFVPQNVHKVHEVYII